MKFHPEDIAKIASKLADSASDKHRDLILIMGLPGVGKTTLAREFVRQTKGVHFDIDDIKRVVVPQEMVTEGIDPPEYRYEYYIQAIRKLPDLYAESSAHIVIMDESFHLQAFRRMWDEAAEKLNIRLFWIEVICDEKIVKERLKSGKDRQNHILAGIGWPMYLLFKKAFESKKESHLIVDTGKDIVPQVQQIVREHFMGNT